MSLDLQGQDDDETLLKKTKAFGLPGVSAEVFIDKSRPSVPVAYRSAGPAAYGKHLEALAQASAAGKLIIAAATEQGYELFDEVHVEHAACDIRKCTSKTRHDRKKRSCQ